MRKFVKKGIASFLIMGLVFTASIPAIASSLPSKIHERKNIKHISSGVVHENIERFTTSGWWNINVVRVDLANPYTQVQGMINPGGLTNRTTVSSMVELTGAVAGVNGDYFSYQPLANSIGTLINNGEVISSPIEKSSYAAPSLFMDKNNNTIIGYMDRTINLTNESQNKTINPYTINRLPDKFLNIGLINKYWGPKSIGNRFNKDLVEVVVDNDIVTDVRINQEAVAIPKTGYVLFARGDNGTRLQEFKVGDKLNLDIKINPDLENIKFAIGGGSIILKNGEVTLTNIHSGGNNPRTGIGVNKDNTELILVTLDGRSSYKGVGQKQFGAIMKELGAYNALNLDGGGSTTMAVKPVDENKVKLVNNPSGASERKVVNGVGVYSNAPVEELDYIELSADDSMVFLNTSRRLSIKGFDKHRNPKSLDTSQVNYSVEGVKGRFEANNFIPEEKGLATITAEYNGKTSTLSLQVLGDIQHLDTYMKEFTLAPNGLKELPNFNGYDGNGNMAKVYKSDVELSVINEIGEITETNDFIAFSNDGAGGISAKAGKGLTNILATVGNAEKLKADDSSLPKTSQDTDVKRRPSDKTETSYSIGVTMGPGKLNDVVKYDAASTVKNQLNLHEASVFLGGASNDFVKGINSPFKFYGDNNYRVSRYENTTFIALNTSKKGIRNTNVSQWNKFKNELNNLTSKNLIVTTSTPVFDSGGFVDGKEADLFHELLEELDRKGVNVFVVQKSNQTNSLAKNGVRYINLNASQVSKPENITSIPILEFIVDGENISYQIRPIFK